MSRDKRTTQESEARILARFGFTPEQIDADVDTLEDESKSDNLTTVYYYGSPLDRVRSHAQPMQNVSVRLSKSEIDYITQQAKKLNLTRSEFMRRKILA